MFGGPELGTHSMSKPSKIKMAAKLKKKSKSKSN